MAIIDVVKWDGQAGHAGGASDDRLLAWKFPSQELSTWTQLIVNESQEAVLFRSGSLDGPFGPGRHVLKTENLPVIGALLKLPFGRSPFTAEVWFVNKAIPLDVLWGTPEPIRLQDPVYNILIPVVAHGQYGVQIEHSRKFLVKLVGTMQEFDREKLRAYFRGLILTVAKSIIAREIVKKKVSILEISAQLTDLSQAMEVELAEKLAEFGLKLINFFVSAIDVKEDDKSIETLRSALAKRAEMSIVGYTYQQERSLNALEGASGFTAADHGLESGGNGMAAAMVGLGVGMGAGVPLGASMGQQFAANVAPNLQGGAVTPPAIHTPDARQQYAEACTKCSTPRPNAAAKFCPGCGTSFGAPQANACSECGGAMQPGAKFCTSCGKPASLKCTECGTALSGDAKFCPNCGTSAASTAAARK